MQSAEIRYFISSRLMGLDEEKTADVESTPTPCIGLCHVEKVNNIPEDKDLTQIKESRKKGQRCVGLCYIRKKNGIASDPHLEKLRKRRPCVGLCYLLKKKMDELEEIEK